MGGRRLDRCTGATSPRMDFRSRSREWRPAGMFSGKPLGPEDLLFMRISIDELLRVV